MAAEDDMDSEDLELYGDVENGEGNDNSSAQQAASAAEEGNKLGVDRPETENPKSVQNDVNGSGENMADKDDGKTIEGENHSDRGTEEQVLQTANGGGDGLAEEAEETKAEGEDLPRSDEEVRKETNTEESDGKGDDAGTVKTAVTERGNASATQAQESSGLNGKDAKQADPKKETDKDGGETNDSEDDSGDSNVSEEEDDDDQDDFEVILNVDGVDTATKPGTIGTVRLPPNKWQRPGYVPPERVSMAPAHTGARPGGVLAMLPTPTQQFTTMQKSVYDLEIGKLTEKPWLERGADLSDYFNYGFNEETWKLYCERQMQMRLEASSLAKIKTVDGNRTQTGNVNRPNSQVNQKHMQHQQNMGPRNQPSGVGQPRPATQNKMPAPPAGAPAMIPPPPGLGVPPGAIPGIPGMPKMPNLPFPFPPGVQNGKGGGFQPPFPPFLPIPNNQRKGDDSGDAGFPFMPGMPGMPMPPPGAIPPGGGPAGNQGRGFPGQMHTPHKGPQQGGKNIRGGQQHRSGMMDNSQGRGVKRPSMDQNSRFGPAQGMQNPHGMPMHPSRQGHHPGPSQGQHQGGQQDDDRRRWNDNRGMNDRRQNYDKSGGDSNHMGGDSRGRGGYNDRYGDRGHDRRRMGWNDDGDRRRGGYDNQRYGDQRRDYDRDRDRDHYRKRGPSRDYDDDRKRMRR